MSQALKSQPRSPSTCFLKRSLHIQSSRDQFKQTKDIFRMKMISEPRYKQEPPHFKTEERGKLMEASNFDSDIINENSKGVTELIYYSPSKKLLNSKPISQTRESIGFYLAKSISNKSSHIYYSNASSVRNFHRAKQFFKLPSLDREVDFENCKLNWPERQFGLSSRLLESQRQRMSMPESGNISDSKAFNYQKKKEQLTQNTQFSSALSSLSSPFRFCTELDMNSKYKANLHSSHSSHSSFIQRPWLNMERQTEKSNLYSSCLLSRESYPFLTNTHRNCYSLRSTSDYEKNILLIQSYLRGYWLRVNLQSMNQDPSFVPDSHPIFQLDNIGNTSEKISISSRRYEPISKSNEKLLFLPYSSEDTAIRPTIKYDVYTNNLMRNKFPVPIASTETACSANNNNDLKKDRDYKENKYVMELFNQGEEAKEINDKGNERQLELFKSINDKSEGVINSQATNWLNTVLNSKEISFSIHKLPSESMHIVSKENNINIIGSICSKVLPQAIKVSSKEKGKGKGNGDNKDDILEESISSNVFTIHCFSFDIIDKKDNDNSPNINPKPIMKTKKKILLHQDNDMEKQSRQKKPFNLKSAKINSKQALSTKKDINQPEKMNKGLTEFTISSEQGIYIHNQTIKAVNKIDQAEIITIPSSYESKIPIHLISLSDNSNNNNASKQNGMFNSDLLSIDNEVVNQNILQENTTHSCESQEKDKMIDENNTSLNPINQSLNYKGNKYDLIIEHSSSLSIDVLCNQQFADINNNKANAAQSTNQNKEILTIDTINLDLFNMSTIELQKINKDTLSIQSQIDFGYENNDIKSLRNQKNEQLGTKQQFNISEITADKCYAFTLESTSANTTITNSNKAISLTQGNSIPIMNELSMNSTYNQSKFQSYPEHSDQIERSASPILIVESNISIQISSGFDIVSSKISKEFQSSNIKRDTIESFSLLTQSNTAMLKSLSNNIIESHKENDSTHLNAFSLKSSSNYIINNTQSDLDNVNSNKQPDSIAIPQLINKANSTCWNDDTIAMATFNIEVKATENKDKEDEFAETEFSAYLKQKKSSIDSLSFNSFDIKASYNCNDLIKKAINEDQKNKKSSLKYQLGEQFEIIKPQTIHHSAKVIKQAILLVKLKTIITQQLHEYGFNYLIQRFQENRLLIKKRSVVSIRRDGDNRLLKHALNKWISNGIGLKVIERIAKKRNEAINPNANDQFEFIRTRKETKLSEDHADFQLINMKKDRLVLRQELNSTIEILQQRKFNTFLLLQSKECNYAIISKVKEVIMNQCSIQDRFTMHNQAQTKPNSHLIINENSFAFNKHIPLHAKQVVVTQSHLFFNGLIPPETNHATIQTEAKAGYDDTTLSMISLNQISVSNQLNTNTTIEKNKHLRIQLLERRVNYKSQLNISRIFHKWHYNTNKTETIRLNIAKYKTISIQQKEKQNENVGMSLLSIDNKVKQMKKGISLSKLQLLISKRLMALPFTKWKKFKYRTEKRKETLRVSLNLSALDKDINEKIKKMVRFNMNKENKNVLLGGPLGKCINDFNTKNNHTYLLHYMNQWSMPAKGIRLIEMMSIKGYIIKSRMKQYIALKQAFNQYIQNIIKVDREGGLYKLVQMKTNKTNELLIKNWCEKWKKKSTGTVNKENRRRALLSQAIHFIDQNHNALVSHCLNKWRSLSISSSIAKMTHLYENILMKESQNQKYETKWNLSLLHALASNSMIFYSSRLNCNRIKFSVIKQKDNKVVPSLKHTQPKKLFIVKTKYSILKKLYRKLMQNEDYYKLRLYFFQWHNITMSIFPRIKKKVYVDKHLNLCLFLNHMRLLVYKQIEFKSQMLIYSFAKWKKTRREEPKRETKKRKVMINGVYISLYQRIIIKRIFRKWKACVMN